MAKLKLHNPSQKSSRTHLSVIADSVIGEDLSKYLRQQGLDVFAIDSRRPWEEIISEVRKQGPQLALSINCEHFPPAQLAGIKELQWINLNLGEIPKYSGGLSVQRAIMSGDMKLEIVLHQIKPDLNRADIIARDSTPILSEDSGFALYSRAIELGLQLLKGRLQGIILGNEEYLESIYCGPEDWAEADGCIAVIDWNRTAFDIHNLIRAFTCPYGGAISQILGCQIRILESRIANPFNPDLIPGTIISAFGKHNLDVATGSGTLRILDYKIRGGIKPAPGDCFESEIKRQIPEGVAIE